MPPRLRYFGEGNRPGLTPVFNGISPLREILARLSEIVKNERPLSLLGSDCIGSGREEGRGRVSRAQSSVEIDTDSCLVMGALNHIYHIDKNRKHNNIQTPPWQSGRSREFIVSWKTQMVSLQVTIHRSQAVAQGIHAALLSSSDSLKGG